MAIGNTISCTLTLYAGVYFSISFQWIVSSLHRAIMNFFFGKWLMFVWFRYYKRAYQELFLSNDAKSSENSSESNNQEASDYYRFGWLLFLVLRIQSFSRFKDLVTSTNELVSVLVRTSAMIKFTSVFSSHAACQSMHSVSQLECNKYCLFCMPAGCTYHSHSCAAKELLQYKRFTLLW